MRLIRKPETLGLAGLLAVMAMLVVTAVGAATASAAQPPPCFHVAEPGTGNYEENNCIKALAKGEYIKVVEGTGTIIASGVWCYQVAEKETGNYEDNKCTKGKLKGEYIKVLGSPEFKICAKVAVAGTGAWEDAKCSVADKTNEYVKVTAPWFPIAGEEWCAPVEKGEPSTYEDSKCTKAVAGGGYIKVKSKAAKPLGFTSTSGVKKLITAKHTIECQTDSNTGEITGPQSDLVTIKFFKCKLVGDGACHSTKPLGGSEEIITNSLDSELSYLEENASPPKVGVDLLPASGTVFTEFECPSVFTTVKVTGSVIGQITPVNTMTTSFALSFKCVSAGKQVWTKDQGGATDVLTAEVKSPLGTETEEACEEEVTNDTLTTTETGEIKA